MPRRVITAIAGATLACGSAVPASGAGPGPGPGWDEDPHAAARKASVRVAHCSREDLTAMFRGRMRRVRGARRMAMRFALYEQVSRRRARRVRAPGLGRWRRSRPWVRVFVYRQWVRGLSDGRVYRAAVSFRWYDAEGHVIRRVRRRSGFCSLRAPLPNLRVRDLLARPVAGDPTRLEYDALVENRGRVEATSVPVRLWVDGAVAGTQAVASLAPGEVRTVRFQGPACSWRVRAVIDPNRAVRESHEDDNGRSEACADLVP